MATFRDGIRARLIGMGELGVGETLDGVDVSAFRDASLSILDAMAIQDADQESRLVTVEQVTQLLVTEVAAGDWGDDLTEGASLDGIAALKEQTTNPATSAGYAKILALPAGDYDDALLFHFDDQGGGGRHLTDFSKYASWAFTIGGAYVDTAQSKWGGASLYLEQANVSYGQLDYVQVPGKSSFNPPWHDFTVECWVRPTSLAAPATIVSQGHEDPSLSAWFIEINTNGTVTLGNTSGAALTTTATVSVDTWAHIAVSLTVTYPAGTPTYLTEVYVDGVRSVTATETPSHSYFEHSLADLTIGMRAYAGVTAYFIGYIDDLRVSNVARYTGATLTVPTGPLGDNTAAFAQSENGEMRRIS
jgi:hypothetical protein